MKFKIPKLHSSKSSSLNANEPLKNRTIAEALRVADYTAKNPAYLTVSPKDLELIEKFSANAGKDPSQEQTVNFAVKLALRPLLQELHFLFEQRIDHFDQNKRLLIRRQTDRRDIEQMMTTAEKTLEADLKRLQEVEKIMNGLGRQ